MVDDPGLKASRQEEGFFDSANVEAEAFGHRQLGRRVGLLVLMMALIIGGGVAVAWAIIAASK